MYYFFIDEAHFYEIFSFALMSPGSDFILDCNIHIGIEYYGDVIL